MYLPESREQSATLLSDFFPQHQCASSLEVVTMGVNLTPALQHACYLKPSCVHLSPPLSAMTATAGLIRPFGLAPEWQ